MTDVLGFDSRYWDGFYPENKGYEYKFVGINVSQGTDNKIPGTNQDIDLSAPTKQWKRSNRVYGLLRLPFHYWEGPSGLFTDPHKDGKAQAQNMYETLSEQHYGKYNGMGELPPALDLEDTNAPKGRKSIQSIKACLVGLEQLFGREPIIYSAGWWFDQWIKPYFSPDKFGGWDIYSYDLWEADPPPDTPIGEWEPGNIAIIQYKLDIKKDGFNARIDENQTTQAWIDSVTQDQQKHYTEEEVTKMLAEQKEELEKICKQREKRAHLEGWNDGLSAASVEVDKLMK